MYQTDNMKLLKLLCQVLMLCSFSHAENYNQANVVIKVSSSNGKDERLCGEDIACKTLMFAIEKSKNKNIEIVLDNDNLSARMYVINRTITMETNITISSRNQNIPFAILSSTMTSDITPMFEFSKKTLNHLHLKTVEVQNSSLVHFKANGILMIEKTFLKNISKFFSAKGNGNITVEAVDSSITSNDDTTYYNEMINVQVTTDSHVKLIIKNSTVRTCYGWNIENTKKVILANTTIESSKNNVVSCENNVLLSSNSFEINNSNFIDIAIDVTVSNFQCIKSAFLYSPMGLTLKCKTNCLVSDTTFMGSRADISQTSSLLIESSLFANSNAITVLSVIDSDIVIKNSRFENNSAWDSGTIYSSNSDVYIENSIFENNTADRYGGTFYCTRKYDSLARLVFKNVFVKGSYRQSTIGNIIWTNIPIQADNITFQVMVEEYKPLSYTILIQDIRMSLIPVIFNSTFLCSPNYNMVTSKNIVRHIEWELPFSLSCESCPKGLYNLNGGKFQFIRSEGKIVNSECEPCPSGGICNSAVRSKDNYWGYVKNNKIQFIKCPSKYCCSKYSTYCSSYNTCERNRHGTLCGLCMPGFSESLTSTSCIRNEQCQPAVFGFSFILMVIFVTTILIFWRYVLSWIFACYTKHISGKRTKRKLFEHSYEERLLSESSDEDELIGNEELNAPSDVSIHFINSNVQDDTETVTSGLIKILFFYYQATFLVGVETSAKNHFHVPKFLSNIMVSVFNFQINTFNTSPGFCPFPGFTAIQKEYIKIALIFAIGTIITVILLFHACYNKIKQRLQNSFSHANTNDTVKFRLRFALIQIMLLGYSTLAVACFRCVHCVSISGEWWLYLQANIKCFDRWQMVIIVFISIWIVPFPFTFYFGSKLLQTVRITENEFFISLYIPLALPVLYAKTVFLPTTKTTEDHPTALITSIYGPYRKHKSTDHLMLWESVLIIRRFAMTLSFIFILDKVIHLYLMLLLLTLFTWHHNEVKPFEKCMLNRLETISLSTLSLLAASNVFWAYSDRYYTLLDKGLEETGKWILCIESICLFLPIVLLIFYIAYKIFTLFCCQYARNST